MEEWKKQPDMLRETMREHFEKHFRFWFVSQSKTFRMAASNDPRLKTAILLSTLKKLVNSIMLRMHNKTDIRDIMSTLTTISGMLKDAEAQLSGRGRAIALALHLFPEMNPLGMSTGVFVMCVS